MQLAFYGATPAYVGVLDHHGWGDLYPELQMLSKVGRWNDMSRLIDDGVLNAFAVVVPAEELPRRSGSATTAWYPAFG
ncbi:oxidoreductase/luciferase-like protein [Mycolicibacterium fortuitum]|jgi:hypothetical protein|uniref:Oxidoreductase/luciferase-like protein n=3 Tax=Mycobacteriaceae TaxID=1762 RepID=A0A378U5P6_MYCFO|nr:oxidoreductase/luciferase-like protein [Mycolicibacterium fortuitum]